MTIEFFFDFASPYAYLASHGIEPIAARHGRVVRWRPMMLGPALAATGSRPNMQIPLKGAYLARDVPRCARLLGVPFRMPEVAPIVSLAAARAFYWLERHRPEAAVPFAKAAWHAHFGEGRNIADRDVLADIVADQGLPVEEFMAGITEEPIKARLKVVTDEALARGVFGAPFFFVDGEPFWGADRLVQIERWLETGGF